MGQKRKKSFRIGRMAAACLLLLSLLCNSLEVGIQAAGVSAETSINRHGTGMQAAENILVSPGEGEEPAKDGLLFWEGHYLLYVDGTQVTEEGWKEITVSTGFDTEAYYVDSRGYVTLKIVSEAGEWSCSQYNEEAGVWDAQTDIWQCVGQKEYYFGKSGRCERIYDKGTQTCQQYVSGKMQAVRKDICKLRDGKFYYFDEKGVRVSKEGWKKASGTRFIKVKASGCVTAKMENLTGRFRFYKYNYKAGRWEKQTNVWELAFGSQYRFSAKGNCTTIYDTTSRKCKVYEDGKMRAVKKDVCRLKDGKLYYFNEKGVRASKKGWKKASARKYIKVKASGCVTAKMEKPKVRFKFYKYDFKAGKWKKQKNVWELAFGSQYHFSKKGNCTTVYNITSRKCKVYEDGKMRAVKKDVCRMKDGKLYYFNSKGIREHKKGWKEASGSKYFQVGKSKWVTAKMENTKGTWKYYKYNYRSGKWVKQKNVWLNVDGKEYYFDGSGNCARIYNTETRKCYDCSKGSQTLVKSDTRDVRGKEYYFGADGVKISEAGMYLTGRGTLIYAASNGVVAKRISGQIITYWLANANGKVGGCRVKDGALMCYYNGGPEPRRVIDTSRPMVALTYDDGPSQYTSQILDILRQYNSVATFFVIGQQVPGYADTVRSAVQMGCEIGNHTYSHQVLTRVGIPTIQSQIAATNNAVQSVAGVAPTIMRPPGGGQNETVRNSVGMPVILWSIDTLDWKTRNAATTQAAVLGKVRDGDIVLMHDLYSQTAEASRSIIPGLIIQGYQLVTVSELSDCRGPMVNGGVYTAFR